MTEAIPPKPQDDQMVKEWNGTISPRLESIRAWFTADEWKKGVQAYLSNVLMHLRENLEKKDNSPALDQYTKGQIDMLKQLIRIPDVIEKQIELIAKNKESVPRGDAGY